MHFFVQQYKTLEPYTILCIVNKKEINPKSKGQPEDPHVKNVNPVFVWNAGPGPVTFRPIQFLLDVISQYEIWKLFFNYMYCLFFIDSPILVGACMLITHVFFHVVIYKRQIGDAVFRNDPLT